MTVTKSGGEQLVDRMLRPGDAGYAEEISPFNLAYTHTPEVVVAAASTQDVAQAVRWAAARGKTVGVQATGHGAGLPVTDGVLVSTRAMTDLQIDPVARTARVGAGVKWRQLVDAGAAYGLSGLCGSSSDVGVVGYTLGGGLPVLGRAFGFAADHVRELEVVTGDGEIRQVDRSSEPDLFWALRGGKGNAGIVTSMTFDLMELTEFYGGSIFFDGRYAEPVLAAYAEWTRDLPEEMCSSIALLRLPPFPDIPEPLRGQFVVALRITYLGEAEAGERLVSPMRAAAPVLLEGVAMMPYTELDRVHEDPDHPVPANESNCLLRDLAPEVVEVLLELAGPDSECPLIFVEVRHMGGALSRAPEVPNAVSGRDAAYSMICVGMMMPGLAERVPGAIVALVDALAPYSTGSMVNLHGEPRDAADAARAWPPETYARLQQVRAAYDPAGTLRLGHIVEDAPRDLVS